MKLLLLPFVYCLVPSGFSPKTGPALSAHKDSSILSNNSPNNKLFMEGVLFTRPLGAAPPNPSTISGNLVNYGGAMLKSVEVIPIFVVPPGGTCSYQSQIISFYKGIVNSPYLDMLNEYPAADGSIAGRGKVRATYVHTTMQTNLDDVMDIQPLLVTLINTGKVPLPNFNTYYVFHTAPTISITRGLYKSCRDFCSYHRTLRTAYGENVAYGVIPDQTSTCYGRCGPDPDRFKNTCSLASHELIEAITDPNVGLAVSYGPPLTWYDGNPGKGEVGDICNDIQGTVVGGDGVTYTVQKQWSNAEKKCISQRTPGFAINTNSFSSTCHSICTVGAGLKSTCNACAKAVITYDPFCETAWDEWCVGEVGDICGIKC